MSLGTYLVCINNEYVRHGDLDLHQFFNIEDISVPVETEYNVADNVRRAIHILEGDEPDTSLSANCEKPYKCAFREYCMRDIPKPSVFDLYRLSSERRSRIIEQAGYDSKISEIPTEYPATDADWNVR